MKLSGLRTVIYKVPDLVKAKDWYNEVFGIQPYFDEPFYVGYNIGGYELGLDPDMSFVKEGNSTTSYWGVVDLKSYLEELKEKKVSVMQDITAVGGDIYVAVVLDPFGNHIGLIENPGFTLPASASKMETKG